MTNNEKYINAFVEGIGIDLESLDKAERDATLEWDSIGFMALIAIIEEDFELELSPEDILSFSSYEKGIEILKKYEVDFTV